MNIKICTTVKRWTSLFAFLPAFFLISLIPQNADAATESHKARQKIQKSATSCDSYSKNQLLRKADKYQPFIAKAAQEYHVSPHLITAVITVESCFRPKARSRSGAAGLMQLMPATARRFGVHNRYNSQHNIKAGTRYLKFLLNRFDGNVLLAAAAYNAGEGAVDKYNGVPPYRQTQTYVKKVLNTFRKLSTTPAQQIAKRQLRAPARPRTREWYRARYEREKQLKGLNLTTRELEHINRLLEVKEENPVNLSFKQFL